MLQTARSTLVLPISSNLRPLLYPLYHDLCVKYDNEPQILVNTANTRTVPKNKHATEICAQTCNQCKLTNNATIGPMQTKSKARTGGTNGRQAGGTNARGAGGPGASGDRWAGVSQSV